MKREINDRLAKEYNSELTSLQSHLQYKNAKKVYGKFSAPLLVCTNKKYVNADIKILFIGQQINRWGSLKYAELDQHKHVRQLMRTYRDYLYSPKKPKTHFWKVIDEFEYSLSRKNRRVSYVWTNLNKITRYKKIKDSAIERIINLFSGVLTKELAILKPNVVIFLTGPAYDKKILNMFPSATLSKVDKFRKNDLTKICHKSLPPNTFRTFHPNYLVRFAKDKYKDILMVIADHCVQYQ